MLPERQPALRVTDDSFAALLRDFKTTSKWTEPPPIGYSESTKSNWAREIKFMSRPDCLGALSTYEIEPYFVQAFFDGIDDRPGKQKAALAILIQVEKWAIVRRRLPRQITIGVEIGDSNGGHVPWTDEQVALGVRYGAHLAQAIVLAANTGQRGSDLIRMCWTDIESYKGMDGIRVRQQKTWSKTHKEIWVPITSELATEMKTWERRPGPFLLRPDGTPWDRPALSNAWTYLRDTTDALKPLRAENLALHGHWASSRDGGLVLHGLRGTACVRLNRAGATALQIADMVGMSLEMVTRYLRFSAQKENAVAAVHHLERTLFERNSDMSNKKHG